MTIAPHDKYVVIDREKMVFLGAAHGIKAADLIAELAPITATCVVMPLDRKSQFSTFGVLELMLLHKNTSGQPTPPGAIHDFAKLVHDCYNLALVLPVDSRSEKELESAVNNLPVVEAPKTPKLPPILMRMKPEELANYVPGQNDHKKSAPKAPRAPAAPGAAPTKGATGRVWEIAEAKWAELGGGPITKNMRAAIIDACEKAGINAGTAATQFGKWKATK